MKRDEELKNLINELAEAFLTQRDLEDKIPKLRERIRKLEEEKGFADEGITMYKEGDDGQDSGE